MFSLDSMAIQSDYQRQEFLREAQNRRLARTVKGTEAKRKPSFSLNLFASHPKEEEHYTGVARRRALNSP